MARKLAVGLPTADFSIYETLRLWRIPNTRHGVSRLFKIPLTPEELLTSDIGAIRNFAQAPREIECAPEDDWRTSPTLVALWKETKRSTAEPPPNQHPRANGKAHDRDFPLAKLEPIVHGCGWLRHARDDAATL
jgi:hypothetical protein